MPEPVHLFNSAEHTCEKHGHSLTGDRKPAWPLGVSARWTLAEKAHRDSVVGSRSAHSSIRSSSMASRGSARTRSSSLWVPSKSVGNNRQPFTTPAGQIGHRDVLTQMQLGLIEDHPAAGAAAATFKRRPQFVTQRGGHRQVGTRGARVQVKLTRHDLSNPVSRRTEHIVVICPASCWNAHFFTLQRVAL